MAERKLPSADKKTLQDQRVSTRELLEQEDKENPLPPVDPIRTRNRAFAELLLKAGHPVVFIEPSD